MNKNEGLSVVEKLPSYIWKIESGKPGPNVVVLGGTHGDEVLGVEIIKGLLNFFGLTNKESGVYTSELLACGNLFLGFGNPVAIKNGTRGSLADLLQHADLNRSFSQSELNAKPCERDRYDLVRARELMSLFKQTDFLFDIHSTSSPSVPFVCFGKVTPELQEICLQIPVQYILTDPDLILPQDRGKDELATTDYAVNVFGGSDWSVGQYGRKMGLAVCYETGFKDDKKSYDSVYAVISNLLDFVGIFDAKNSTPLSESSQRVYKLSSITKSRYDNFHFLGGLESWTSWKKVFKGEQVGVYENGEEEHIPYDGVIVFPSSEGEGGKTGNTLFFLAKSL